MALELPNWEFCIFTTVLVAICYLFEHICTVVKGREHLGKGLEYFPPVHVCHSCTHCLPILELGSEVHCVLGTCYSFVNICISKVGFAPLDSELACS